MSGLSNSGTSTKGWVSRLRNFLSGHALRSLSGTAETNVFYLDVGYFPQHWVFCFDRNLPVSRRKTGSPGPRTYMGESLVGMVAALTGNIYFAIIFQALEPHH